jgi:predicted sugar kinase
MGGAYASPEATAIVDKIRGFGQFAVGQSSWGPTIFAIGPSEKEVNWLVEKMADGAEDVVGHVEIVSADNHGMKISFND